MHFTLIPTGAKRHVEGVSAVAWAAAVGKGGAAPSSPGAASSSGGAGSVAPRTLVTASDDGLVGVWSAEGEWHGALLSTGGEYGVVDLHACPAQPDLLAAACSDGTLRLFTARGGANREEKRVVASAAGAAIVSVRWSLDGSAVATGGLKREKQVCVVVLRARCLSCCIHTRWYTGFGGSLTLVRMACTRGARASAASRRRAARLQSR